MSNLVTKDEFIHIYFKSREDLQTDRTRLKADIVALKTQITEHKHQALVEKKKMDQTKQSVTSLEHNLKRSNNAHNRQQKEVQKAITGAKALRNQIKTLEIKVEKQRKALSQTEEEVRFCLFSISLTLSTYGLLYEEKIRESWATNLR